MASTSHVWKFYRIGGLDHVAVETADDLLNLKNLDQKLWVALSCPVKGLELDEKTLALIDTDKDGRIRVPELLHAIDWAAARLRDVGDLLSEKDRLPLERINDLTPEGKGLIAAAKQILSNLGSADLNTISIADAADIAKVFAATKLNGDGIVTLASTPDETLQGLIRDVLATEGGVADRSGAPGVDQTKVDAFYGDCVAFAAWQAEGISTGIQILGTGTSAAAATLKSVRAKINDYFARTRLAAFDTRALAAVNRAEDEYLEIAARDMKLTAEELAAFPLTRIDAGRPLSLFEYVNPAWADALATFHRLVVSPLFGSAKTSLTVSEWSDLQSRFSAYFTWEEARLGAPVEKLGLARVKEILANNQKAALSALIAQDAALADQFAAIGSVEQLLRYVRDFRKLVVNFVNFTAFYSPVEKGVFQAGTLYLDSRSTELCVRVDAPNPLAAMSKIYIAYCDLKRAGQAMKIAACFTQGDSDYMFVGRNGLFYDRQGRDWDATITTIVDNPISIRQAFWAPYKKFVRMIEEHVAKRAAAADAAANERLSVAAATVATADKARPAEPKKVDVGTVAAIGVAITGAISAFTLILGYVFGLKAWQYPLVFLGLVAVISGPSMLIAWIKLRQRTLGPILEGNGWAINGRVKINVPFGAKLTARAIMPKGSRRSLEDPYEDKDAIRSRRQIYLVLFLLAATAIWIRWDHHQRGHYFWQSPPVELQGTPPPRATEPPAAPTG